MRDIPSIEYAGTRCGNYGFYRPQIYGVSSNLVSVRCSTWLNQSLSDARAASKSFARS